MYYVHMYYLSSNPCLMAGELTVKSSRHFLVFYHLVQMLPTMVCKSAGHSRAVSESKNPAAATEGQGMMLVELKHGSSSVYDDIRAIDISSGMTAKRDQRPCQLPWMTHSAHWISRIPGRACTL